VKNDVSLGLQMDPTILDELDVTRLNRIPKMTRKAAVQEAVVEWIKRKKRK
jgi:hypothetical protein